MAKTHFAARLVIGLAAILLVAGTANAGLFEDELLEPDKAFAVQIKQKDKQTLIAQFNTAKSYYLYKERMRFATKNSPGVTIQAIRYPAGIIKQDPNFGRTEVFKNKAIVEIALLRAPTAKVVTLVTDYQGCEEKRGVCYQPMQKTVTLNLN